MWPPAGPISGVLPGRGQRRVPSLPQRRINEVMRAGIGRQQQALLRAEGNGASQLRQFLSLVAFLPLSGLNDRRNEWSHYCVRYVPELYRVRAPLITAAHH